MSDQLLEVSDLRIQFPVNGERVAVVNGIDLQVSKGEVLALVGESGCGKSLSALACMRLVPKPGVVSASSLHIAEKDVLSQSVSDMRSLRGQDVAMIFQEPMTSLNPVQKVGDQVVEAIRLHESLTREAALKRTLVLFEKVGIPDPEARLRAYPHQLSGGMKQRVMIAMALSTNPKLLIADEPTTALDVTIQAQILELLRQLQDETEMSILLISHDLGIVNELADRISVMYAGEIVEEASRQDLFQHAVHPYTRGLLRSIPSLARPGEPLEEIPGVVPSPGHFPEGCRFSTRCLRASERCQRESPRFESSGSSHRVRCFHPHAEGQS